MSLPVAKISLKKSIVALLSELHPGQSALSVSSAPTLVLSLLLKAQYVLWH